MELKLINDQGQQAATVSGSDTLCGRDYNEALVHQVVTAYQANGRFGNRAQLTRAEVRHSTKKPFRQKGTGRARAGMTSSPLWRGGGRIFPNSPDENSPTKKSRRSPTPTTLGAGKKARASTPMWRVSASQRQWTTSASTATC